MNQRRRTRDIVIIVLTFISFFISLTCYQLSNEEVCDKYGIQKDVTLVPSDFLRNIKNSSGLALDDPALLTYIRYKLLGPPSKAKTLGEYGKHYSQANQSQVVDRILRAREHGFFIECGAAEGFKLSNSLFFETTRNWTGLLIEADHTQFKQLLKNGRNAYLLNACLSPYKYAAELSFKGVGMLGGIAGLMDESHLHAIRKYPQRESTVQCFPLYSVLKALGRLHVDYFSLDVEGAELYILRTIPWDLVKIDVLTVEYKQYTGEGVNTTAARNKLWQLREFFSGLNTYVEVGILPSLGRRISQRAADSYGLDVVFARKDVVQI